MLRRTLTRVNTGERPASGIITGPVVVSNWVTTPLFFSSLPSLGSLYLFGDLLAFQLGAPLPELFPYLALL